MEKAYTMRTLLRLTGMLAVVLILAGTGAYFYGRKILPTLPEKAKLALKEKGVELTYKSVAPTNGLGIGITDLSVTGDLPWWFKAKSITASVKLAFALPPVKLSFAVGTAELKKNEAYESHATETAAPMAKPPKAVFLAALITQLEFSASEISVPDFGVSKTGGNISVSHIGWKEGSGPEAFVRHDIVVGAISKNGFTLEACEWGGNTILKDGVVTLSEHELAAGPLKMQLTGKYEVASTKWNLKAEIPLQKLTLASIAKESPVKKWLKAVSGELGFQMVAQGIGADEKGAQLEGNLKARQVAVDLARDEIQGRVTANTDMTFAYSAEPTLSGQLRVDLTDASLKGGEHFYKPKAVPLKLAADFKGTDKSIGFSDGDFTFNNLKITFGGNVTAAEPRRLSLRAQVPATSLTGWENFFPKFSTVKTRGLLSANLSYDGLLENWQRAEIEVRVKATEVKAPILPQFLTMKELSAEGIAELNSDTEILYSNGQLRKLATQTRFDLRDAAVKYADMFQKPVGIPASADLTILSTAKKATIQKGDLVLGRNHLRLKGSVDDFLSPRAAISFETDTISVSDTLVFSPLAKSSAPKNLRGTAKVRGTFQGPLFPVDKTTPLPLKGELSLRGLAFDYTLESTQRQVRLQDLTGDLRFTAETLSTRKLRAKFVPSATAIVDLDIHGIGKVPTGALAMKVENAEANELLAWCSDKGKDLAFGKLALDMKAQFAGADAASVMKSLKGGGTFSLKDGGFKTLRFSKGPLETLKGLPLIGKYITKTEWDEKISTITGKFAIQENAVLLSDTVVRSPYFDVLGKETLVTFDQQIKARVSWIPKAGLLPKDIADALKDGSGQTNLPLTVTGSVQSPSVGLDMKDIEGRLSAYASRRLAQEKDRALKDAGEKAKAAATKAAQEALKNQGLSGLKKLFQ